MAWKEARRTLRGLPKDLRFLAYQNYKNYGKNKEQEEKLIKSFNCFFENFDNEAINKRKAVKIIYN